MARQPAVVGRPARSIRSFTATVVPTLPIEVREIKVVDVLYGITRSLTGRSDLRGDRLESVEILAPGIPPGTIHRPLAKAKRTTQSPS
jgi:hypothetical protein